MQKNNEKITIYLRNIKNLVVDEYQDVSAIQETILNGLKRNDGTQFYFYVGDVKQSIYRFRQAEPTLFLSKLASFSDEEDAIRKIFYNGHLFIIRNGNVYNGNGQIVK